MHLEFLLYGKSYIILTSVTIDVCAVMVNNVFLDLQSRMALQVHLQTRAPKKAWSINRIGNN